MGDAGGRGDRLSGGKAASPAGVSRGSAFGTCGRRAAEFGRSGFTDRLPRGRVPPRHRDRRGHGGTVRHRWAGELDVIYTQTPRHTDTQIQTQRHPPTPFLTPGHCSFPTTEPLRWGGIDHDTFGEGAHLSLAKPCCSAPREGLRLRGVGGENGTVCGCFEPFVQSDRLGAREGLCRLGESGVSAAPHPPERGIAPRSAWGSRRGAEVEHLPALPRRDKQIPF